MTNEERDLITRFIERVGGPAGSGGFSSVPTTTSPNLPPIDRDADALLAELFQKYPEARYRITQVAVVQEQALAQASQRITAMQAEMQRLQAAAAAAPASGGSPWGQPAQPAPSRGLFGGLFGGGQPRQAPPPPSYAPPPTAYAPPQPGYAQPGYGAQAPGMFQPQGRGFLGGALQTAAGVAGGVLAANALTSMFSGGHGGGGGLFGGGAEAAAAPGEVGYLPSAAESPWGGAAQPAGFTPDPFDQGGAAKDAASTDPYVDNASYTPDPGQDSGWQDTSSSDSGWTDSGSGGDSGWTDSNT